nr:hypothetical protein [Tanacetum cinerariifolium]
PPPPPSPAGPSGASGSPEASGSSQVPPPPPLPPSTNQEGQSKGFAVPSSSKTTASAEYQAWTMTDIRLRSSILITLADLQMDDDMAPDTQEHSSDDEVIRNAHIPKVNLRQDWWKPFEKERPATPEPAWSIPSSNVPVPKSNWASALASTYSPPPEDSLLAIRGSDGTGKKKGRIVALTTDDMQKRKNDVKARTTLLLALPDEHQLRFNKHKTAQELWAAILKTFGGNEATKKTKKNLLKQQYGNFKAEGSETLEQTFNRLQNMAFISSAKHSSGNEEVNTASTNVSTASSNVRAASISQDTACAYITSQSNGSQIKFKDINQIDEDDMKEMDIKWNIALLSMRADRFWKKTGKKITIQGTDVAGFDKSKVECFNCHKMGHFPRECRAPKSQDRGRKDNYRQGSKIEEQAPKALMAVDGVGWDWSYMANYEENHALVADEEAPTEFALMAKTSAESEVFDNSLCSKACKKNTDSLNSKITELTDTLSDTKNMIYHYKLGLSQVEGRLAEFKNKKSNTVRKLESLNLRFSLELIVLKVSQRPTENKTDKGKTVKKPDIKKFPTGSMKFSTADMGKKGNAIKASAAVPEQH